jgi:U3 small nucleolar RNA-associated protein 6
MADLVQVLLEEMVPELEHLLRKRLVSQPELQAIVKVRLVSIRSLSLRLQKRRRFEYALKRRGAPKMEYLRYINYELSLDRLLRLRRRLRRMPVRSHPLDFSRGKLSLSLCFLYYVLFRMK